MSDVVRTARFGLNTPSGNRGVDGSLAWTETDPLAAHLTMHEYGETVTWTFALDLLREGLAAREGHPVGEGNVRVLSRGVVVFVELHSICDACERVHMQAEVSMLRDVVSNFLHDIERNTTALRGVALLHRQVDACARLLEEMR